VKDNLTEKGGSYGKQEIWVLDTIGSNFIEVLGLDYIDTKRTVTNDIMEIYNVLGMDAARQAIYDELSEVLEFDSAYVDAHHMSLLCDRMTASLTPISLFRHKINNDDIGPIAKASFEETPEMFLRAARHAELDTIQGISANVMCGQEGLFGTAAFQVILDMNEMNHMKEKYEYEYTDHNDVIESNFDSKTTEILGKEDMCSIENLTVNTNISHVKHSDLGQDTEYDPFA
jgi:DNA-directed RNA polymerase II subunit RPB1